MTERQTVRRAGWELCFCIRIKRNAIQGGENNMADKTRFLDRDYTRRQFLKLSGKSLAGLALSTSLLIRS